MAKKRRPPSASLDTVAPDRARRMYRMVAMLAKGPQTRDVLRRALAIDVRGFYRDLLSLRDYGIDVGLRNRSYQLDMEPEKAYTLLPFPDPHLTLGQAQQLARGKTEAHRKLKTLVDQVVATARPKQKK
jgi:hypothetical protein